MTRLAVPAALLLALPLAACGGAPQTDQPAVEDKTELEAATEQAGPEDDGADRSDDYPKPGEEATVNPIAPGNEEPGGKDQMLPEEREAMEDDPA